MSTFKNKTIAAFLAAVGGTFGLHRFYLHGSKPLLPWLYCLSLLGIVPAGLAASGAMPPFAGYVLAVVIVLPATFCGFIEALVFALTPDAKWDVQWNADTGRSNNSGWLVVIIAALTLVFSVFLLMSTLAIVAGNFFGANESL